MSSYIRFETNVPVVAALKFAKGLQVQGQYGDQMMFTTVDDQKLYLDLPVAEKLAALNPQRGERVRITKREVRNGNRKSIEWQVERADDAPPSNSEVMRNLREQQATPEPAPQPKPTAHTGSANLMAAAVMQAVEAAKAGEEHAKALGMSFKFTEQHLSSFACTIYIQHAKLLGGNTTWQQ